MSGFLKTFSSLILALGTLLGILFLSEENLVKVKGLLDFLSKSDSTAVSFGYYLVQKAITGTLIFLGVIIFSVAAKRAYDKHLKEKLGDY